LELLLELLELFGIICELFGITFGITGIIWNYFWNITLINLTVIPNGITFGITRLFFSGVLSLAIPMVAVSFLHSYMSTSILKFLNVQRNEVWCILIFKYINCMKVI
jgi:hypothetical protein